MLLPDRTKTDSTKAETTDGSKPETTHLTINDLSSEAVKALHSAYGAKDGTFNPSSVDVRFNRLRLTSKPTDEGSEAMETIQKGFAEAHAAHFATTASDLEFKTALPDAPDKSVSGSIGKLSVYAFYGPKPGELSVDITVG